MSAGFVIISVVAMLCATLITLYGMGNRKK